MSLALIGFVTIAVFLALILLARVSVLVALILVPVAAAFACGSGGDIAKLSLDGLKMVAPVGVMITFAILYFGLMFDVGLFTPLVRRLMAVVRHDPVRLCLVTAALPMLVALDGDGATTFLIAITTLLPVHRRLGLQPLVLPTIVGLSAGVMNLLPWGGPTARAMTALGGGIDDIFVPVIPALLAGIAWVFAAAAWLGLRERKRLRALGAALPGNAAIDSPAVEPLPGDPLFKWNALLTVALITLLFRDLYANVIPVPLVPAPLAFMVAFAIALPLNRHTAKAQHDQLSAHAPSVVLVVSMIFAAGIFSGILNGTGMLSAMAKVVGTAVPGAAVPWLGQIVAVAGMPLSLAFTPDAFYFGILPVSAETVRSLGGDPMSMGRAAIMGQMTTGFPLSPLTASTFILIGLSEVSLRDHQRHMFGWALGTTLVMTIVATATGALTSVPNDAVRPTSQLHQPSNLRY